ncbi:DinB family protein [Nocardia sp. NPDC003482]
MDACAECGFDYDLARAAEVADRAVAYAADYAELLALDPSLLRRHADPGVWSPLEYACHVRDVLLVMRERVLAARRTDTPTATPMGRDERVDHDGYADQRPEDVARQLRDAALLLATVLNRLGESDWERTLVFTYPAESLRSLRWIALHTEHELHHHLLDIRRQVTAR